MRPRSLPLFCFFCVILAAAAFATVSTERPAAAQSDSTRAQARDHYLAGKRLYDAGSYQQAITEFQTADQMSPSGVNDFNIGLCYDKLGDASSAIAAYKSYLTRVPDAANRATVEASIAKLTDAAKKQEADAAAKKAADDAAAKKAADAAAKNAAGPGGAGGAGPAVGATTNGTVAPAAPANTGDPDLDRVAAVDLNSVRDQRRPGPAIPAPGGGAVGTVGNGPAAGAPAIPGASTGPTATASVGNGPGGPAQPAPGGAPEQPKPQPAYKKWWFWVIVGVGVVVAINVLSSSPQSGTQRGALMDMPQPMPQPTSGVTLWHF